MILLMIKIIVTLYIVFSLYTGAIVLLADSEKVSSEYEEWLTDIYSKTMGVMMLVAIVLMAILLIGVIWKGEL